MKESIEQLLKALAKWYTNDPVAERLSDTHYSKLKDAKRKKIVENTKNKFSNRIFAFVFIMYGLFALIFIGGFVLWSLLDLSFGVFFIFVVVAFLFGGFGYLTNDFLGEIFKLGDKVFLNMSAKNEFAAEYKYFKKHGAYSTFVPTKTLKVADFGTSDATAILLDGSARLFALSGEGVEDDCTMSYKALKAYRIIEDSKTVFLSRRECTPTGLSYFGYDEIEAQEEVLSKNDDNPSSESDTVKEISVCISYTHSADEEVEVILPYCRVELVKNSSEYKKAVSNLLSVVRALETIINPKGECIKIICS